MNWDKLKIFHAVAEAGSFTSATVVLNISQSAISRQIQSLEEDLNVKLFDTAETYPPTPNHHRSLLSMIAFKFKTITRSNSGPELITRAKAIRPTYSRGNKNNEERFLNFDTPSRVNYLHKVL